MFTDLLAATLPLAMYTDPGAGLALFYALAAAGMGVVFKLRRLRMWIVGKFRRRVGE